MIREVRAPGLGGDWLNGWLAAIGVTILVESCRLRWTEDRRPLAVFSTPSAAPLPGQVAAALPAEESLRSLAIATRAAFPRRITLEAYEAAAERARRRVADFSVAASVTDLVADATDNLPHSRFDPGAPNGITLWERLLACRRALPTDEAGLETAVAMTFDGRGPRRELNGLGFDVRRIEAGDPPSAGKYVDPAIECLAFYGLSLFPVRGAGTRAATRGWRYAASAFGGRRGETVLRWPLWSEHLDQWGVDGLLGRFFAASSDPRDLGLGIHRTFATVSYRGTGDRDTTVGYATRRT